MAQKCVHKGCGKVFTDPEEECVYHPGPPEFHEGQKGWKCCKPRVLTFDEFLSIPPCTTGKHSTVDETTAPASKPIATSDEPRLKPISTSTNTSTSKSTTLPIHSTTSDTASIPPTKPATPDPRLEEDSDDPSDTIQPGLTCKRRSCNATSTSSTSSKDDCTYHPGIPVFHEGSKGWSCCKRRVLEFDEFMKIEGCKTRQGHCFIGKRAREKQASKSAEEEEILQDVRNDFYQTPNTLIVSFYLKKIDKEKSEVEFTENGVELNLVTSDKKRFQKRVDTYKELVVEKCEKKILGTKLEMVLYKKESGFGWPRLTREGVDTGERIQVGKALRA